MEFNDASYKLERIALKNATLKGIHQPVTLRRTAEGVPRIKARTWEDAYFVLGWLHGRDRGGQVAVTKIVAEGRICEKLKDSEDTLEMDVYFRRLGLARDAHKYIQELKSPYVDYVNAYVKGMNTAWRRHYPWLVKLLTGPPELFCSADVLLLLKFIAFAGLAEGQRVAELFLLQAVRRGVSEAHLKELFPALDGLDPDVLKGLLHVPSFAPGFGNPLRGSSAGGSNAWVVSGARTESGLPLLANDPHLEVNRLPGIVYEVALSVGDRWVKGATIPGLPGFLSGRTSRLAWGVTYSCADTSDFYVERCQQGRYLRDGQWRSFHVREERIRRKRNAPIDLKFYENEHGVCEDHSTGEGDCLCWSWVGFKRGGLGSLQSFTDLLQCEDVVEAQTIMAGADVPTLHMVFADTKADIGYQFTGAVPRRREGWSGLAPVAGWDSSNDWQGFRDATKEMPREVNPQSGHIVITNEARQRDQGPRLSTIWLSDERHQRITQLLNSKQKLNPREMCTIQYDVLSLQVQRFLSEYLEHVPAGEQRTLLESWDQCYTAESRAATLFHNIHRAVIVEVFGGSQLGRDWIVQLFAKTSLYPMLSGYFDAVLGQLDSLWLPAERRRVTLARGVGEGLARPYPPWGQFNSIVFANIFLGGRAPGFLGFDRGPYPLPGNHATVHQGTILTVGKRTTGFAPCYHMVAELADRNLRTNTPGGPSESRFSRWYASDLKRWLRGKYKLL